MTTNPIKLYQKQFTIRWQDMDAFNHVNHSIYLIYMQECRIAWLAAHGIHMETKQRGPIIGEINCKYLRPLTYPATISVELYYSHSSGRRIYFEHILRDSQQPTLIYANAKITVVWVDFTTGKAILPPPEYNHILSCYKE